MAMTKIYEDANDQHVRNFVVYGKTADKKLYYESTYTTQVSQADMETAFKKGALLIVNGSDTLVPVSMTTNKVSTVGTVSSAVALVEWTSKATA